MLRVVLFLIAVGLAGFGLSWLADQPGNLLISWGRYEIETSLFRAVVLLALLIGASILSWSILRQVWQAPATMGLFFNRRRQRRGLDALSSGMIAIGAGDRSGASKYAVQARRALPDEPLTHLLRAQAAQLSGDRPTARRIFEAMLGSPETELLGLRGLFLEAEREGEKEAARQFAERAVKINPKLGWPVEALFDLQCKSGDWAGALRSLSIARRHGHIDKAVADRRRAVLLTGQAQAIEESDPNRALQLALDAHNLAADLVPAAAIASRILAGRGNTGKAAKVIQRTWRKSPHPELAMVNAFARIGDSTHDRLSRAKQLAQVNPYSVESQIAVASAAIDAREFATARSVLAPLLDEQLTQRIATLMARIEGEEHGDKGRVREWLARAVHAPRDPAWTADGRVSDRWAPVSPVTGQLDAFTWQVPAQSLDEGASQVTTDKLEQLMALGRSQEPAIETPPAAAARPAMVDRKAAVDIEDAETPPTQSPKPSATPTRAAAQPPQATEAVVPVAAPVPAAEVPPVVTATPAAAVKPAAEPRAMPDVTPLPTTARAASSVQITGARGEKAAPDARPDSAKSSVRPAASGAPAKPQPVKDSQVSASDRSKPAATALKPQIVGGATETSGDTARAIQPAQAATVTGGTMRQEPAKVSRAETTQSSRGRGAPSTSQKTEPRIFVAPRAPDDPGPDGDAADTRAVANGAPIRK